jgi:hypothetical protein
MDEKKIVKKKFGKMMEIRCVVEVIRNGESKKKKKMKVEVRKKKLFEIFEKYDG